ncbi:hypothetical protein BCV69DRAFT_284194 [Microstroma glucosiphilum]|uniref:Gpi16 subunit, GPI transamidase component n=1 Tax=Pseudomicrostroma glucosiphilum TaxID=1684307 RepID=A0A316U998_9BASI|nr:hypothetical protein BCV69DRAFT_284194 [Pseudomicrostroma glucosiphilum]PWN19565.1 hypothetical protein BCV69DRAFT_284194 [Pseudomicrostroma glucosiphilum]
MTRPRLLALYPFTLLLILLTRCAASSPLNLNDDFTESLHLRPLPLGRVQSTFTFTLSSQVDPFSPESEDGVSFHLLPPSLLTLLHFSPLHVKELHLAFNKGRWNHARWGMPTFLEQGHEWGSRAVASGVEAWVRYTAPPTWAASAALNASTVESRRARQVQDGKDTFHDLLASLAGHFCSTLSASGSKEAITSPLSLSRSLYDSSRGRGNGDSRNDDLLYTLSIPETPCTEVLYRMLTLLPCRANAGLASLLAPHKWLEQEWHGVELVVRRTGVGQRGWEVEMRVGSVWNGVVQNGKRDFSMNAMFGRPLATACPLAKESFVSLLAPPKEDVSLQEGLSPTYEVQPALLAHANDADEDVQDEEDEDDGSIPPPALSDSSLGIANALSREGSLRYLTTSAALPAYVHPPQGGRASGLDVSLSWPDEGYYNYSSSPAVQDHTLHVSRSYVSSSLTHSTFSLRIRNDRPDTSRRVVYRETLPWWLLPSLPSAQLSIVPLPLASDPASPFIRFESDFTSPSKSLLHLHFTPSIPRVRAGVLEMELRIPAGSELSWEMSVGREVIRYEEHNPDAHRGLETGAGTAWEVVDDEDDNEKEMEDRVEGEKSGERGETFKRRRVRLTEGGQRSIFKTEVGLVELAVPDFSMPYSSAVNLLTRSFRDVPVPPATAVGMAASFAKRKKKM